jgi:hypothetical protein
MESLRMRAARELNRPLFDSRLVKTVLYAVLLAGVPLCASCDSIMSGVQNPAHDSGVGGFDAATHPSHADDAGNMPPVHDAGMPGAPDAGHATDAGNETSDDAGKPTSDAGKPEKTDDELEWHQTNLTTFTSYPDDNSDECKFFNGCMYKGQFAAFKGMQQSYAWVMDHNILAVHSRDFDKYVWKTLRIKTDDGQHRIEAVVYDECADSDCDGCCTRNASETGFLIDMESFTYDRFGSQDGVVEWACVDC